ncbi:MAG: helix-turn-helix transcriptional regulator [Mycobacteriales bacterium]
MTPVFSHGRLRLYLLKLLDESPRHGYDVIRELESRFLGLYSPSAGTIYPRLARLETEGLVAHSDEGGRKVYRITDAGRDELRRRAGELAELEREITDSVDALADQIAVEARDTVSDLRKELKQAAKEVRRRGLRDRLHQSWVESMGLSEQWTARGRPPRSAGELNRRIRVYTDELTALARQARPDQAAEVLGVLDDAVARLRAIVD